MRVLVTGASGKAGKWVVSDLVEAGYDVLATDVAPKLPDCPAEFLRADLTDYGHALELMAGVEAVAHLANIPAPGLFPPAYTINTNNAMNVNVFLAAADRKVRRVAWASSETTLGLPFDVPPRYAPVDEAHYPVPTSTYALSKVAAETMAEQKHTRELLRRLGFVEEGHYAGYARDLAGDPHDLIVMTHTEPVTEAAVTH